MAADTCLDGGSGGLEVEAHPPQPPPPAAQPQTPAGGSAGPGSEGRGMACGGAPARKGPAAWPGGRPRAGWRERRGGGRKPGPPGSSSRARRPRAFCVPRPSGRGRSRAGARGEGPPVPLEPQARAGIPAADPRPPPPRAAGLTGPRAPRSAENRARIKVGGAAEEQGEASGVLNASRVRLIIKLIKASI